MGIRDSFGWALGAAAAGAIAVASPALAEDSVTFASWGGSLQEAQRKALMNPAEEALGITIREDTTNGIADVRAQVLANAVKWDITEQGSNTCVILKSEGRIEPLDYSVIDTTGVNPAVVDSHWIGVLYYSTVIGWNTDKFGEDGPETWADFWDVEKFPGARAMYAKPYYNLEAALMADGVPMDQVYDVLSTDEGLDRAFAKLEEIKPHVAVWWRSGAQSAQLIKDGEVDMISIWNGRISSAIDDGASAALTFNQGVMDFDCLVVPKGAPNKQLAMKVINEFLKADNQANLPQYITYGPTNEAAFDTGKISPEVADAVNSSPQNAKNQLVLKSDFYIGKIDELQERFDEMIQE